MERITIATINIAAASKERARRILDEWIAPSSFDVYVLTETSEGAGTQLIISEFKMANWSVFQRPTLPKDRGVTILSRIKATEFTPHVVNESAPGRSIVLDLHTTPSLQLVGMYVPNRGNDPSKTERKKAFLNQWLQHFMGKSFFNQHRILLGDLNVVPPTQRPQFLPQEQFEYDWYRRLVGQCGLYDAAIEHNVSGHESTWVAHTGEGYTYDHILPQKSLLTRIAKFEYDHSTRLPGGVTDHSAIVLSIDLDDVSYIHRRGFVAQRQAELFQF